MPNLKITLNALPARARNVSLFAVATIVSFRLSATAPASTTVAARPDTEQELLSAIHQRANEDLLGLLEHIDRDSAQLDLDNAGIDQIIHELERIAAEDSYQKPTWSKVRHTPANARYVFANRRAARKAIESLKCRKIANELRTLPIATRVERTLDYVEGRIAEPDAPYDAAQWFRGEIVRLGKDAVPIMLNRATESTQFHVMYAKLLCKIGDPRGIDFILQTLNSTLQMSTSDPCEIIGQLGDFQAPRVLYALAEAMQKDVREVYDMNPRQRPGAYKEPTRRAMRYPVRPCAANMLTRLSGTKWSILFSEDPESWIAWLDAEHRDRFDPAFVERTPEELDMLIENFTYRVMGEYMSSVTRRDGLLKSHLLPRWRGDLLKLGPQVPQALLRAFHSIPREFPVWETDLRNWTRLQLTDLDTPESRTALKDLTE